MIVEKSKFDANQIRFVLEQAKTIEIKESWARTIKDLIQVEGKTANTNCDS